MTQVIIIFGIFDVMVGIYIWMAIGCKDSLIHKAFAVTIKSFLKGR